MASPRYILRVSVEVHDQNPISGLESEQLIPIGSLRVKVTQRGSHLILQAEDFDSEDDAKAFLPQIKVGLWSLALQHNIAFSPSFARREIIRSTDPEAAAYNFANLCIPVEGQLQPLHGNTDEGGYTIFPSHENIVFFSLGKSTARGGASWPAIENTLREGMQRSRQMMTEFESNLPTVFDLYLSHFYENTIQARFLTLIMALEVIAPVIDKHHTVMPLLAEFETKLEATIQVTSDKDALSALKSLQEELRFRKGISISQRLRSLILNEESLNASEREDLAKKIGDAYGLRSTMLHDGISDAQKLSEAMDTTLRAVKLILRARLGLST
ncbi:HEPN domain-containing protein [Chitinimonas sp. BJB300]|uniref:HEPN domain-containing protein n=1 Tax=Chitinimonas sp. BJB300 TaxID=1559339 RepID=UPI0011128D66|nr:HEPN domain-containing protein [Chitinimonas sp. BJB300]TSJ84641.1 hypothetical protein FG002_019165 [Chitinimonas sp. BJB300]